MKASIHYDKEVLVINFKGDNAYVDSFEKNGNEVTVTYRWRRIFHIVHSEQEIFTGLLNDIDPYDTDYIALALPQDVEIEEGYWRRRLFRKKEWISPRKRLRAGRVELQTEEAKTVITTQYRIIK